MSHDANLRFQMTVVEYMEYAAWPSRAHVECNQKVHIPYIRDIERLIAKVDRYEISRADRERGGPGRACARTALP